MSAYYEGSGATVFHGDCIEVMRGLADDSVDAVVTDPPYGLEFMGKDWDAPWKESGINRDAGFNGGGMDVTKNLPSFTSSTNPNCSNCGGKRRGRRDGTALVAVCVCDAPSFPNTRATEMRAFQEWCELWAAECLRVLRPGAHILAFGGSRSWHRLAAAIEEIGFEVRDSIAWLYGSGFPKSHNLSGEWEGWGTALKPAFEPIVVGRKPVVGTVAANVLAHGTGAINIDATRTSTSDILTGSGMPPLKHGGLNSRPFHETAVPRGVNQNDAGRWPTNVILDESQATELDAQAGMSRSRIGKPRGAAPGEGWGMTATGAEYNDEGGPSRFFPTFRYEAKAGNDERPDVNGVQHPTVKPLDLMRWLVRLVTPPAGTVLEPFAGSGTTIEAALIEGFDCIGIEREDAYLPLIMQRIKKPLQQGLFGDWDGAA